MDKKLGFKDFLSVDYAPGEPDQVKYNAKKRKVELIDSLGLTDRIILDFNYKTKIEIQEIIDCF